VSLPLRYTIVFESPGLKDISVTFSGENGRCLLHDLQVSGESTREEDRG